MKTIITNSAQETKKLAASIAKDLRQEGGVVALSGELGAGKTTFVQGFAKELGIKEKIISPTFVLVRQHQIPKTKRVLYHIDLYRLDDPRSILQLGIGELVNNQNIILIEWAEKMGDLLPKNAISIKIDKSKGGNKRIITTY